MVTGSASYSDGRVQRVQPAEPEPRPRATRQRLQAVTCTLPDVTTGLLDRFFLEGTGSGVAVAVWFISVILFTRAVFRRGHVRHDADWARTQLPDWARGNLTRAIQVHQSAVGSMSRPACHGWAWMIAVNTPDGPVVTTGHARSKKAVDRKVAKAAERGWVSGDRDLRYAEYFPEPPGE